MLPLVAIWITDNGLGAAKDPHVPFSPIQSEGG